MTLWQQLLLVIALVLMVLDGFSVTAATYPRLKPGWLGVAIAVIVWATMHMPKG